MLSKLKKLTFKQSQISLRSDNLDVVDVFIWQLLKLEKAFVITQVAVTVSSTHHDQTVHRLHGYSLDKVFANESSNCGNMSKFAAPASLQFSS